MQVQAFACVECGGEFGGVRPYRTPHGPACPACGWELYHAGANGPDDGRAQAEAEAAYLDEGAYRRAQSTFTKPLAGWEVDRLDALAEGSHGGDSSDRPSR
jgi:hypothetical protein